MPGNNSRKGIIEGRRRRKEIHCEKQLTQELHQHLEDKKQVDMIVLDFSKAFDKVPHQCQWQSCGTVGFKGVTMPGLSLIFCWAGLKGSL